MSATNQSDSIAYTTIDLLRHGICEGGDILRGSTDVALLPEGLDQMDEVARHQPHWNRIVSSPLKRCCEFAERLAEQRNVPLHLDDRWQEIDFGDWDGVKIDSIRAKYPKESELYYNQPTEYTPPAGEPILEFQERVVSAFKQLFDQYRGEHLLVVQHGGTARVLLAHILNAPLSAAIRIAMPYACLTRIRVFHESENNYPVLLAHLPEPSAN